MKSKNIQSNFLMKVPNTQYGWDLIAIMKENLNKKSYRLALRGTGIDETKIGDTPKRYYWQSVPLKYAKEIRIYVHAKIPTWTAHSQVVGISTLKYLERVLGGK